MAVTKINLNGINELDLDFGTALTADVSAGVTTVTGVFATGIDLQTNGTDNGDQAKLNLKAGTNVTMTDDGVGGVTIAATGGSLTAPVIINTGTTTTRGLEIIGSVTTGSTPAFVQGATGYSASGNPTAAFGSSTAAGNCILVAVSQGGFGHSGHTVTDTAGNTYTLSAVNTSNFGTYIYTALNILGGANTVTVTQSDSATMTIAIHEYSGVATVSALETSATASAFGSPSGPATVGPITTVNADLVFTMFNMQFAPTATISGYTIRETNNNGVAIATADANQPAGTYTPTWVVPVGGGSFYSTYGVAVVALKSGAGTGQIADLAEFQDASTAVLSSVNGIGQFVMTTTAGHATNTPATGALNYNTVAGALEVFNGSSWVAV